MKEGTLTPGELNGRGVTRGWRRDADERQHVMFVHTDPSAVKLPHAGIKRRADVAVHIDTKRAMDVHGVKVYLSVQAGEYDVWVADCPKGIIPPDFILSFWDCKHKTMRG